MARRKGREGRARHRKVGDSKEEAGAQGGGTFQMIPGRPGGRTYCRAPLSPPWGDPGAFLLGSRSPLDSACAVEFPRVRAPPPGRSSEGPPATWKPCLPHLHRAGNTGSFFAKQISSLEQLLRPTPSCLAHRLIHLLRIKRL